MIGIIFLSLIITIEYLNTRVFTSANFQEYQGYFMEEFMYIMRTSLWKYHLMLGIGLVAVFLLIAKDMDKHILKYLLITSSLFVALGGALNFILIDNILHYIHIFFVVIATGIFLYIAVNPKLERVINE